MSRLSGIAVAVVVLMPTSASAQFQAFGFGGGTRVNSSYSPLLNVYNGQTSLLQIQSFNWYPTNLQVVQAGGAIAFVPQYQPIPQGLNYPVQAAVSGNGMYTRLNLAPTFGGGGLGPPMPQTTFITPVFAGGAAGRPVPFTTVLYPPSFTNTAIQTSVMVPNGGAAFVGGNRYGTLGRNQWGAPVWGRGGYNYYGNWGGNGFWAPGLMR